MGDPIVVGTRCRVERQWMGHSRHNWLDTVVRITKKRAYLTRYQWFALDDPKREVKPRYLEYTTVVLSTEQPGSDTKKEAKT